MRTLTKEPAVLSAAARVYEILLKNKKVEGKDFLLKKLEEIENVNYKRNI